MDYYLVSHDQYQSPAPTPLDNLITLYGLEPVARSLARTNPDGSKGVKLRKSYKNHIQDLPGKHQISQAVPVNPAIMDPDLGKHPNVIAPLDPELLRSALQFDKTPSGGIPGFNPADLAINDQQTMMRDEDDERRGKRKKKSDKGPDAKRPHYG
ncbi:mediator of RNA polymerase II transcription subunit 19 [Diutina catenulata]